MFRNKIHQVALIGLTKRWYSTENGTISSSQAPISAAATGMRTAQSRSAKMSINNDDPAVQFNLGIQRMQEDDTFSAVACFQNVVAAINAETTEEAKKNHLALGRCHSTIGHCQLKMQKNAEAIVSFTNAARHLEEHNRLVAAPPTAYSFSFLATVLMDLADELYKVTNFAEALERYKQGLSLWERVPEANENRVASVQHCTLQIADCQEKLGKFNAALDTHRRILDAKISVYGKEPFEDVADSHLAIGMCLFELDKVSEAIKANLDAISILERVLVTLPRTVEVVPTRKEILTKLGKAHNNVGAALFRQGETTSAIPNFNAAIENWTKAGLPLKHPHVSAALNSIALCHAALKQDAEELAVREKLHKTYVEMLSPGHPTIAASYGDMAAIHERKDDPKQAIEKLNLAIATLEKASKPEEVVMRSAYLNRCAACYEALGNVREAQKLRSQANEAIVGKV